MHRKGKRRNGKRIMHMMSFFKKVIQRRQIIKIEGQIGRMISCSLSGNCLVLLDLGARNNNTLGFITS